MNGRTSAITFGMIGAAVLGLTGCHSIVQASTKVANSSSQRVALPNSFRTYQDVLNSMGPYLANHTSSQVWIPTLKGISNFSLHPWMNVQYSVTRSGYTLTVSGGPKLPANSTKIIGGNANLLYTITALSKNSPIPKDLDWGTTAADVPNANKQSVDMGHGITGTLYTANVTQGLSKTPVLDRTVVWKEDGWAFEWDNILENPKTTIGYAEGMEDDNLKVNLPIKSGEFISGEGSGAPSQVEFVVGNTRYIMYASGGRALQIMETMKRVK